jgi:hypothetical protein
MRIPSEPTRFEKEAPEKIGSMLRSFIDRQPKGAGYSM